jgi:hypothetical protein
MTWRGNDPLEEKKNLEKTTYNWFNWNDGTL